jgi:serine/threonine-protein kinase
VTTLDLNQGAVFAGDFRVLRPLAQGGMGAVYVVEQISTGRERALKVMHPLLVADEGQRARFVQEAKVGGLVDSDHVVEVIGAGVDDASKMPWLCMELLQGESLQDRIDRAGPLRPDEMVEIAVQLRHAISRAHDKGLIHRDLKPDNLFLERARRSGVPFTLKVLDFGIAKLVQQAKGRTAAGTQAVGSPLWMAPEQANAEPVSPATDVWAIGLIAFTALTGKVYWKTASSLEDMNLTKLLVELLVDPIVPASQRAAELGSPVIPNPDFDAWFARCVARDVAERFENGNAALGGLLALLGAGVDALSATMASNPSFVAPSIPVSSPPTSQPSTSQPPASLGPTRSGADTIRDAPRRRGTSLGLVAAAIAGSLLVLFVGFGIAFELWLFSDDDEPRVAQPTVTQPPAVPPQPVAQPLQPLQPQPVPPTPIAVQPAQPPVEPPPSEPPAETSEPTPRPRTRPVATTALGRRFYSAVVRPCWERELARGSRAPTRMRIELLSGPSGVVDNVRLPRAWQGTPFAACVVQWLPRGRVEAPGGGTVSLRLPGN